MTFDFLCTLAFWGEAGKLLAQLGGALFIARLTVRWALGRYKSEKRWERQLGTLTDLLGAIAELREINAAWLTDEARKRERAEEVTEEEARVYRATKRKVEGMAGIAAVLLPSEMLKAIEALIAALNRRYDDYVDDLISTDAALDAAQDALVGTGRRMFGDR